MIADRGYDSDAFREALVAKEITPSIPSRRNHKVQHPYGAVLYRQRRKIETMFGRIKDWRRIAMPYDRRTHTFMSAISRVATVIF